LESPESLDLRSIKIRNSREFRILENSGESQEFQLSDFEIGIHMEFSDPSFLVISGYPDIQELMF